jgi:hypothetical protein
VSNVIRITPSANTAALEPTSARTDCPVAPGALALTAKAIKRCGTVAASDAPGQAAATNAAAGPRPRPKECPAFLQAHFERALRNSQISGRFVLGSPFEIAQHQRRPVTLGKPVQLIVQNALRLTPSQIVAHGLFVSPNACLMLETYGQFPMSIEGDAVRNAMQPAAERSSLSNRTSFASQDEKGRLECVLCVGLVGENGTANI